MIIFFDKNTGEIVGTVRGRVHQPDEMKMWIGDKATTDRVIVEWKPEKWYDKEGNEIPFDLANSVCDENGELLASVADFAPDCHKDMKPLVEEIDNNPSSIHSGHVVDLKTKLLRKKNDSETKEENDRIEKQKNFEKAQKDERDSKIALIKDEKQPIEKRFRALLDISGLK